MPNGKKHVFISHSARDDAIGRRVLAALEAQGITCWYSSRPADLEPGAYWDASIGMALDRSAAVVCILSSASNESKWVWREIAMASDRDLSIFPLRVENVRPKGGLEPYLVRTQFVDALSAPVEQHLPPLIRRLHRLFEIEPSQSGPPADPNRDEESAETAEPYLSAAKSPELPLKIDKLAGAPPPAPTPTENPPTPHRSPSHSQEQQAAEDRAAALPRKTDYRLFLRLTAFTVAAGIMSWVAGQYVIRPLFEARRVETNAPSPRASQVKIKSARLRTESGDVLVDVVVEKTGSGELRDCYIKRVGVNYDTALNLSPFAFPSDSVELQFSARSDVPGTFRVRFECSGVASGPADAS